MGGLVFGTGTLIPSEKGYKDVGDEKKELAKMLMKRKLRNQKAIKLAQALQEDITLKQLENVEKRLQKPAEGIKLLQ